MLLQLLITMSKANNLEALEQRIDRNGPIHPVLGTRCHLWTGYTEGGYGRVSFENTMRLAHRVIWMLVHGPIPLDTPCLLHRCSNPPCVNVYEHLYLGTHVDNARDREECGHSYVPNNIGSAHSQAAVTEKQVVEIRRLKEDGFLLREIAAAYNIHIVTVSNIIRRVNWKHVP